jgi:outer membrane murein-binding lipoprotein Lpp
MKKTAIVLTAVILSGLLFLTGCFGPSEDEIKTMIDNAVDAKEAELNVKIDALEENVAEQEATIEELNTELEEKEKEVSELEEQLEEQQSTEAEFEAGKEIEVSLGGSVGPTILKDNDIEKLFDGKIDFDGEDYDAEEVIELSSGLQVMTSVLSDEKFSGAPYLGTDSKESISYRIELTDLIDLSEVGMDKVLELPFLGDEIQIVDVVNSGEITILFGEEVFLDAGDSIVVSGKEVTLVKCGTNGAVFDVDGEQAVITIDSTKTVNGVEIFVDVIFNEDGVEFDSAVIFVGENIKETIASGDYFELGCDDDECEYVYDIKMDNTEQYVGILHNEVTNDLDRDFVPKGVEESFVSPNGYIDVLFKEITEVEYVDYELYFDEVFADDELSADIDAAILKSSSDEGFVFSNGDESSEVYIYYNTTASAIQVYYVDDDNDIKSANGLTFQAVNDELALNASFIGPGIPRLKIGDLVMAIRPNGANAEEAEATDVIYAGVNIGKRDYGVLGFEGIVIEDVEDNADNDEVRFSIPSEVVEATVLVK